jgi:hypothetical protein
MVDLMGALKPVGQPPRKHRSPTPLPAHSGPGSTTIAHDWSPTATTTSVSSPRKSVNTTESNMRLYR